MSRRWRVIIGALAAAGVLAYTAGGAAAQVATAASFPNDPGQAGVAAGWKGDQWSLLGTTAGIDAPTAWSNLSAAGRAPGAGVTVAVLDTGVAYRSKGSRFARDPDLAPHTFVKGHDFVDDDHLALDENGHGTHVAATIAQATDNGLGEAGIAYGARIMPVRVLDSALKGHASAIAAGIKWASKHGADVINLSLDFGPSVRSCSAIPTVCAAIARATRRGALVVAAAGNAGRSSPAMPAAAPHVLSVSASTALGCMADSSNTGAAMTAPGGGTCAGESSSIVQYAMKPGAATGGNYSRFGFVGLSGTSQAAAETSAAAALVISSKVIGAHPKPKAVAKRLRACARPAGQAFGAGILDAGRATTPGAC